MQGIQIKDKLASNGYTVESVAESMGVPADELHQVLQSDNVPRHVIDGISEAIGKNIFFINENAAGTNIEGNNNLTGDNINSNNNNVMIRLINIIEKKDEQIEKLLRIISKQTKP